MGIAVGFITIAFLTVLKSKINRLAPGLSHLYGIITQKHFNLFEHLGGKARVFIQPLRHHRYPVRIPIPDISCRVPFCQGAEMNAKNKRLLPLPEKSNYPKEIRHSKTQRRRKRG